MGLTRPVGRVISGGDSLGPESFELAGGAGVIDCRAAPIEGRRNQDAAAWLASGATSGLIAVADGVGGERDGSRASSLAVDSLAAALERRTPDVSPLRSTILDGIEEANRRIVELGTGGASTIAVLQIEGHVVRPYHVGDSVILVVGQRGRIKHQSIPHGPVGYAVEAGIIEADEALHHDELNVVSNVLGADGMRIEVGPHIDLAPHDTALVASDGLSDNMFVREVVEIIRKGPLAAAAERLASICRERMSRPEPERPSKVDDLSFVLYRRGRLGG